jgi:hypothetical protein
MTPFLEVFLGVVSMTFGASLIWIGWMVFYVGIREL